MDPLGAVTQVAKQLTAAEFFTKKCNEASVKIMIAVITLFQQMGNVNPGDFQKTAIEPIVRELSNLDKKTGLFFQEMVKGAVEEILNEQAYQPLRRGLILTGLDAGKFVSAAAWPVVKQLIADLNAFNPSIIDQAISHLT